MQTLDLKNDERVDNSSDTKKKLSLSMSDKITLDTYKEEITNYHG